MPRDIPAAALANLESLASTDFKANLGRIIHDIYQVFIITTIFITIVLTFFINIKLTITMLLVNFKLTATLFSDGAHNVLGHATGRPQEARQVQVSTNHPLDYLEQFDPADKTRQIVHIHFTHLYYHHHPNYNYNNSLFKLLIPGLPRRP